MKAAKEEVRSWEQLSDKRQLDEGDRKKWVEIRKRWLELEEKSLALERQRAKLKWINEGDENSRFFHSMCKMRERKNAILGLNIGMDWVEEPEMIKRHIFEFFKLKF